MPALLVGVLLAAGLAAGCDATGGAAGCRPASAAPAVEIAPKPRPKKTAARKPVCTKANSPIWQGFQPYRGDIKTNGKSGRSREYYQWDYTHGEIEVFDSGRRHKGAMNPSSGAMIKPAVPGRTLGAGK